jgi:hypothetical protein
MEGETNVDVPVFRASKRRKIVHKRAPHSTEEEERALPTATSTLAPDASPPTSRSPTGDDDDESETSASIAEILRRRKLNRIRRAGVGFSSNSDAPRQGSADTQALVLAEAAPPVLKSASERFAPQTGVVSNVTDKHM